MKDSVRYLFLLVLLLFSFQLGRFYDPFKYTVIWEQAKAFPEFPDSCVTPTEQEAAVYDFAAAALKVEKEIEESGAVSISALEIGAKKFLSHGIYRYINKKSTLVCPPEATYRHVSDIITQIGGFNARLVEYELKLASKLTHPSSYIVERVAASAFSDFPNESELFQNRDIRPYARSVLAYLDADLTQYAERAYRQISALDSLGTGAAQIAVAARYQDALPRTEKLMHELLVSVPKGKAIPKSKRDRLYELAYAVNLAGRDGEQYLGPIKELMNRQVESFAPPFGMIELSPKRMCRVLENISGKASLSEYPYCLDDQIPFEQ